MPRAVLVLCLVGALLALPAAGHAATRKAGSFSGTLGVKVPRGARAEIRAISRADGTVTAVRSLPRSGAFKLGLPAGSYLVLGTVVPRPGGGAVTQVRTAVSLRPGQRRAKVNIKKTRKRRKAKKRRARSAFVQELGQVTSTRVAVEIPDLGGSPSGELGVVRRGINDYMTNDVVSLGGDKCDLAVIEVDRRADLIKELEFQQSPYVDPSTRVTRNLIIGDVEVVGTVNDAPGGRAAIELRVRDRRTGKQLAQIEKTFPLDNFFPSLDALGRDLVDELCKLHPAYDVTLDVKGEGNFATHSTAGNLRAKLRPHWSAPRRPVWRDSGPLQWQDVTFTSKTDCSYVSPVIPGTTWSVTILDAGEHQIQVTWTLQGPDSTTASVDCPGDPDPPPIPGQPGPSLINVMPQSFTLPDAGGTQNLSGIVADGGDGFFNTGTLTVTPNGVAPES